jgi:hypothetical protein
MEALKNPMTYSTQRDGNRIIVFLEINGAGGLMLIYNPNDVSVEMYENEYILKR